LVLTAAPIAVLAQTQKADAPAKQSTSEKSLYERLGGVFAIAAVVDHFSDAVVKNPIVGQGSKNPQLREWHTKNLERLPGLKFMRTLWVCNVSGGPFQFKATKPGSTPLGLEEAHKDLRITPAEFDEVAAELGRTLDFAKVPKREKDEVLAAFPLTRMRSPPVRAGPVRRTLFVEPAIYKPARQLCDREGRSDWCRGVLEQRVAACCAPISCRHSSAPENTAQTKRSTGL